MAQWIEFTSNYDEQTGREIRPEPGDLVFISRYQDLNAKPTFPKARSLEASLTPWTTNKGGTPLLHGWLGTTNNLYREADGAAMVLDYYHGGGPGDTVNPPQVKVRRLRDDDARIPEELRG